jgi:hypothetical protein
VLNERKGPARFALSVPERQVAAPTGCWRICRFFGSYWLTHIEVDMMRHHTTTPAQRAADKLFKKLETKKTTTEYAKAQEAFHENRERLKAERLAREAKPGSRPK